MRRETAWPFLTPGAGVLAVLVAVAWVRLGPLVPVVIGLPILGVVLTVRRPDATALLLPLCLLPYAVSIGGLFVSASDLLVLGLACCLMIATVSAFEPSRAASPLMAPAVAFVAWTLASAVWAESPAKAMVDAVQRLEFVVFGVALMAALPFDGRHARRALLGLIWGAAALGIATVIVGIMQNRYVGVYPVGIHKNAAGSLLSYGLLAALGLRLASTRQNRGRWLTAGVVVTLAGMIVTGSRGAWVGTLVAVATIVAMRRPHLIWPVVSVTVIAVPLFLLLLPPVTLAEEVGFGEKFSTASVRAETWQEGTRAIKAHPFLGVGAGNFVARFSGDNLQGDPNNLVLLTWAETGLPGLAFLGWFLISCLRLAWQNARAPTQPAIPAAASQIGVALLVSAVVHAQFDLFWTRGSGLAAFLGAGLVVWANRALIAASQSTSPARRTLQPLG